MSERSFFTDALSKRPGSTGLASHLGALDDSYGAPMPSDGGGMFSGLADMLSDNSFMSGITGLGSTIAQLIGLPSQIEWAKTNTDALKQNMAIATQEQDRRNKNISGYNSIDTSNYA